MITKKALIKSAILATCGVLLFMFLTGCSFIPDLARDAVEIADDTAIKVSVSKEALQRQTNADVNVKIYNQKDDNSK